MTAFVKGFCLYLIPPSREKETGKCLALFQLPFLSVPDWDLSNTSMNGLGVKALGMEHYETRWLVVLARDKLEQLDF